MVFGEPLGKRRLNSRFNLYEKARSRRCGNFGKIQVNHRIVVRDQSGRIITDRDASCLLFAKPLFEEECLDLKDGCSVALQHGARIVQKFTAIGT
jgi:uncharacterized protein involved in tellurium resistance